MASFAPIRGTRAQIQATPIVDGQFLIETDQGVDNMIYIDEGSTRTIVGGNTVSGVLPELYIYSETGSVVTVEDAGGNAIPTSQVGTDHWTCELPDYGVYTITSVLSGETTTQSIDVNDCMIYTIDASHFHVNIVVTYPSGVGASCQISGGGETYSAPALNPPNTSYKFVVHGKNTTYTITTTVDGATKTATVTSGTTIDQTYEVAMSYGQINLTVETPPITGDITCTDGVTTIIKPASANMVFYVPNTGTWDISGSDGSITYSTSAIITSLSTPVSAGLNTGLDLASWITAGSTTEYPLNPSSYADFSALEADEAAVRQLMTVHASVDYLAQATAGDGLMESVIGSDVCAKWINLSDYALDTLSANADIKSVMDEADKYGYGEWAYDGTSWGPKGNAPVMTANNAPYGEVVYSSIVGTNYAYQAFDGNDSTMFASGTTSFDEYIGYKFPSPVCVKKIYMKTYPNSMSEFRVRGSNDGSTWTNIETKSFTADGYYEISNNDYYMYYSVQRTAMGSVTNQQLTFYTLQFYGRELKPLVPIMTGDNTPKGEVIYSSQLSNTDYAGYKAFGDESQTKAWLPAASDTNPYIGYKGNAPFNIKMVGGRGVWSNTQTDTITYEIYGSDTGGANDWHDLNQTFVLCPYKTSIQLQDIAMSGSYKCYKLQHISHTTDDLTVGSGNMFYFYGMDYSEKEFATGSTRKYIYDHGVELAAVSAVVSGSGASATKESNELYAAMTTNNYPYYAYFITDNAIDFGTTPKYTTLNAHMGTRGNTSELYPYLLTSSTDNIGYALSNMTAHIKMGYVNKNLAPYNYSLDVSSLSGNQYVVINWGGAGSSAYQYTGSVTEVWLE